VDDLSNWYIRRSRDRFWGAADAADTKHAFHTLSEALVTVSRLLAPVTPFLADWLHRALGPTSVHLARFPEPDRQRDEALERGMDAVRTLSSLGRAAREAVRIRVRQPLAVPARRGARRHRGVRRSCWRCCGRAEREGGPFLESAEELVRLEAKPNFRSPGPALRQPDPGGGGGHTGARARDALGGFGRGDEVVIDVGGESHDLLQEDLEVVQVARGDLAMESGDGFTVALDPSSTRISGSRAWPASW
jgi:isoleucyl-tRNA synthetase